MVTKKLELKQFFRIKKNYSVSHVYWFENGNEVT